MLAKVNWRFIRKKKTNIVVVIGEGECEETTVFLIGDSLKIIRIAKMFQGIPTQTRDEFRIATSSLVVVRTALLFRTERNLIDFLQYMKTHQI